MHARCLHSCAPRGSLIGVACGGKEGLAGATATARNVTTANPKRHTAVYSRIYGRGGYIYAYIRVYTARRIYAYAVYNKPGRLYLHRRAYTPVLPLEQLFKPRTGHAPPVSAGRPALTRHEARMSPSPPPLA